MSEHALRVAVVGCGNISGAYGETMSAYSSVRIAGATDVDRSLSAAFVDRFGGVDYPSLDDVLADPEVDAIVNLTFPSVHAEVTTAALEAGKHVHSEKPLAGELREPRGRSSTSPPTGDSGSRARRSRSWAKPRRAMWRLVESGAIGAGPRRVRGGELEPDRELAPSPAALLPHRAVRGRRRLSTDDPHGHVRPGPACHRLRDESLSRPNDDRGRAVLAWRRRTSASPSSSSRAEPSYDSQRTSTSAHTASRVASSCTATRDRSSSRAGRSSMPRSSSLASAGSYEAIPWRTRSAGTDWGRALGELSDAIASGRPHRATGAQGAHIVEILDAIERSAAEGRAVEITSSFSPPSLTTARPRSA